MSDPIIPDGPIVPPATSARVSNEVIIPDGPIVPPNPVSTAYDMGRGAVSGLSEGVAGLAGLPSTIWNAAGRADKYLFGTENQLEAPDVGGYLNRKASELTGGFTDYTPQTYLGKTAKEIGSLAPAAAGVAMTGGASLAPSLIGGAVIPGIAGTAVGEGTEKIARMAGSENPEKYGDWARLATEIVTPMGTQKAINSAFIKGNSVEPLMQTRKAAMDTLEKAGIPVTAASFGDPSQKVLALGKEMRYANTANQISKQGKAYTDFLLNEIGLPKMGIGQNLQNVIENGRAALGEQYGKVLNGVAVKPSTSKMQELQNIVDNAGGNLPGTNLIRNRIAESLKTGVPIEGEFLSTARKTLNRNLNDLNPTVREYTKEYLSAFDDMLDDTFKSLGDPDAMKKFADIRSKYRNVLAIEDAAFKSRNAGFEDMISPHYMQQKITQQGGKSAVRGSRGDIGAVTEAAKIYLPKDLNPAKLPVSKQSNMARGMIAAGSGALGFAGANAIHPALSYAGMAAAPLVTEGMEALGRGARSKVMGSNIVQSALKKAALNPEQAKVNRLGTFLPAVSAFGEPREGRKSGGRVSSHEIEADQLVLAAERAKKGHSADTEGLLNTSDDAVANALEIANRSI